MRANAQAPRSELIRGLGFTGATALTIGSIIGGGVFFKAAIMSQQVGTPMLVLAAWLAAGLLSLAGALTYAELGGMLPEAGGEYIYIRAAYGDLPAFLDGWTRFVVFASGVAALGAGFAAFLSGVVPIDSVWAARTLHLAGYEIQWRVGEKEAIAVAVILIFGIANCFGVRFGGSVQTILTAAKIAGLLILIGGVFFFSKGGSLTNFSAPAGVPHWSGATAFGAAVLSALWACDGWAFMPMVAREVRNPRRNVPRALIAGLICVLVIYGLANLAYFYALPFDQVATANSTAHRDALPVASKAAATFLGARGPAILSVVFMISIVGALNGVILATARVPFAMARHGVFFRAFGELGKRSHAPIAAILVISIWSSVLALSGTYDQLTDITIFSEWIFYALAAGAVFILRRTMPGAERPYRTLGYPVTPIIFIAGAVALVANSLRTSPVEAAAGLTMIALGLPFYFYCRRMK